MNWSRMPGKPGPQFPHLTQRKGDNNLLNLSSPSVPGSFWSSKAPNDARLFPVHITEVVDKRQALQELTHIADKSQI